MKKKPHPVSFGRQPGRAIVNINNIAKMDIFKHSSQQAGGSGTTPPPPANDEKLFKAIKSQTRFEKLHSRFSQKDFVQENERWRLVAVVTSYLINALSISGAFYGAFSLFQWFGAGREISGALAVVLLALVEIARRWAADGIWDKWFHVGKVAGGLLALNLALFAISASSSGYGIYTGIEDSAPPVEVVQDSTLTKMESEAAAIRSDIETAKKTKWRGTVTVDAQRTIKSSSKSLATLTDAITERRAALSSKQEATEQEHRLTVQHVGMIAVGIYLLLEIVFQCCIRFVSLIDWREYVLRIEQGQKTLSPTPAAAAVQIDPATLASLMANVKTGGVFPLNFTASVLPPVFNDANEAFEASGPATDNANRKEINANRQTQNVAPENGRICVNCGTLYVYGHARQKYCSENCRVTAWQRRTGKQVKKGKRKAAK